MIYDLPAIEMKYVVSLESLERESFYYRWINAGVQHVQGSFIVCTVGIRRLHSPSTKNIIEEFFKNAQYSSVLINYWTIIEIDFFNYLLVIGYW